MVKKKKSIDTFKWNSGKHQVRKKKIKMESNRKFHAPIPDLIHEVPKLYQTEMVQIQKLREADRGDKYTPNYTLYIRASL